MKLRSKARAFNGRNSERAPAPLTASLQPRRAGLRGFGRDFENLVLDQFSRINRGFTLIEIGRGHKP
jgi:hypothetical protein